MWGCSLSPGSDVAGGRFEVAEHNDERQARELLTKICTVFDALVLRTQMSFHTCWLHRLLLLSAVTYARESFYVMLWLILHTRGLMQDHREVRVFSCAMTKPFVHRE